MRTYQTPLFVMGLLVMSLAFPQPKSACSGKKIVTLGDSITAACGYQPHLVDLLGVSWSREETSSGTGGHARMALGGTAVRPANSNSIFLRAFDVPYYQPDIILVYGSQNDGDSNTWGSLADKPYTTAKVDASVTLAAAYMGMVENLMRENPKAKIYLVTLMRVKAVVGMNPTNAYAKRYKSPRFADAGEVDAWEKNLRYPRVELIRAIGKKYGLPVIDLWNKSGVSNENADQFYGNPADDCTQVHPNPAGYRRMAECIATALDPSVKRPPMTH